MPKSEGLNDPFSAVYCHFQTAPKLMIGDFNCRLHTYAMNREPEFFKETVFGIDECHCKGHTGCSVCYNMRLLKNAHPDYNLMNDSACEQRNNIIKRMARQATYMNLSTFMIQARLLFEIDNRNIRRKLEKLPVY